jgi:hypothetical protein
MNLTWSDIGTMAVVGSTIMGILYWALRGRLGNEFVTKVTHDDTLKRLGSVERRLELAPSHDDFKAVNANVGAVALQMATMTERVDGMRNSLGRIEGTLKTFVEARLQWDKEQ